MSKRFVTWLLLVCLLIMLGRARTTVAQAEDDEYRVKAAFLFHFAQLVDWPSAQAATAGSSLSICTYGDDPFQGALETTIAGKPVGSRTIRILHLKHEEQLAQCHILFLGRAQARRIPTLLANLGHAPLLTVGETPGFLRDGGMICFFLQENKVRFEINPVPAVNAGLTIGSRLMVLAQKVVRESEAR
jgi:hypothetical protein